MFVAMFMALPLYFITSRCCQKEPELAGAKGGKVPAVPGGITTRTFFLLMIPALFDLVGTALAKCGLLFVNVSVYQLVRCSVIVICKHLISPHAQYRWFASLQQLIHKCFVSRTARAEGASGWSNNIRTCTRLSQSRRTPGYISRAASRPANPTG